jgi:hypothetical protein
MSNIVSLGKARVGRITVEIHDDLVASVVWNQDGPISSKIQCSKVAGLRLGEELLKIHEALLAAKALIVACDTRHPSDDAEVNSKKMSLIRLLNDLEVH